MSMRFISESIRPDKATFDTARMAAGGPGLPGAFYWRDERLAVKKVVREWRDTAPCRHGSGERYINKHWFEFETEAGQTAKVYFERRARGKALSARWWLFSLA